MKRLVTMCAIAIGLVAASTAMALDLKMHPALPPGARGVHPMSSIALGCDNGTSFNSYVQAADERYGNRFDFGAGGVLSVVTFTHNGYGVAGPYDYDIEVWDPASCTLAASQTGLVAGNAAVSDRVENLDMCSSGIRLSGPMLVTLRPKTCVSPTDCYPDLQLDNQIGIVCPYVIKVATPASQCNDVSAQGGPFLLRISLNGCATPAQRGSWGSLKSVYR